MLGKPPLLRFHALFVPLNPLDAAVACPTQSLDLDYIHMHLDLMLIIVLHQKQQPSLAESSPSAPDYTSASDSIFPPSDLRTSEVLSFPLTVPASNRCRVLTTPLPVFQFVFLLGVSICTLPSVMVIIGCLGHTTSFGYQRCNVA